MKWEIEYTDEFGEWWDALSEGEQESVRASVKLLGDFGPKLPFPHSSGIKASRQHARTAHYNMPADLTVSSMPLIPADAPFC